jgi:transcriptional regulator with XRE-family HTH domain
MLVMSAPNDNVSRIVRTLLAHQGRTRADLAKHFGVHASVITKALSGRRDWDVDDLVKMADFFQVGAATFLMDADELIPAQGDNVRHTQGYGLTDDELLMVAA